MLRRLEKRILVDLPTEPARLAMFQHHLPPVISQPTLSIPTEIDYQAVAKVSVDLQRTSLKIRSIKPICNTKTEMYIFCSCFSLFLIPAPLSIVCKSNKGMAVSETIVRYSDQAGDYNRSKYFGYTHWDASYLRD